MKKFKSINRAIKRGNAELRNIGTQQEPKIGIFAKPNSPNSNWKGKWYRIS